MHSGYLVGTVLALLCSGYLIRTDALQGWPSTFYVSGILTLIWLPFWIIYVTETPHSHPWITAEEKHHIENSLRTTKDFNQRCLPWRKIFVSRQVWIVMACYVMDGWANYTLLVCVPQYMDKVLNFPLDQNGALSSMPYVFALIFIYLMSFVDAWLVGRGWISIPNARKLWSSIGAFGKSILLLVIGYMDTSCRVTIICLLVMNIMLSSATLLGFNLADLDLAPPYAGFLYSVFNACSTLSGVVAPLAVGGFTSIYTPVNAWRDVFILASAISCLCGVIYLLFGHAELLSWIIPLQQDIPEPSYEVISSMPQVCGEQLTISAISRPRGSSRCSAVRYKPILSGHEVEDDSNDEI
ncbi:unnamed protein product [Calicophoron daubneyi]|uniref:Uncharacterized protein n=1 Tax=Calicophoron daubneyi TaxID=300641 RepID=A0AAV2TMR6_CALDB